MRFKLSFTNSGGRRLGLLCKYRSDTLHTIRFCVEVCTRVNETMGLRPHTSITRSHAQLRDACRLINDGRGQTKNKIKYCAPTQAQIGSSALSRKSPGLVFGGRFIRIPRRREVTDSGQVRTSVEHDINRTIIIYYQTYYSSCS